MCVCLSIGLYKYNYLWVITFVKHCNHVVMLQPHLPTGIMLQKGLGWHTHDLLQHAPRKMDGSWFPKLYCHGWND